MRAQECFRGMAQFASLIQKAFHAPAVVLAGLVALPVPLPANLLLNGCATITIVEGQGGVANCNVQNLGNQVGGVIITGVFAYVEPFGPDFSDNVLSVHGVGGQVGTVINPMGNANFQFAFTTDNADTGGTPDFGLNVFSVIMTAQDMSDNFIPGSYTGGIVDVVDNSNVTVVNTVGPSTININSPSDYGSAVGTAKGRGLVNSDMPEPGSAFLLALGLFACGPLVRKRFLKSKSSPQFCR
jgi:hypothetical protein